MLAATEGRLRTAGGGREVGRIGVAQDDNLAGRRVNGEPRGEVAPAAAQIRRLEQGGQGRVEPGDERIFVSAPVGGLSAAGGAGQVGRDRPARKEDLSARRMNRDALGEFELDTAKISR